MKELLTLNRFIFKYKWRWLFGTIFIVISNFMAVYIVRYVGKAIDFIGDTLKSETAEIETLLLYGSIIIIVPLVIGFLNFMKRQMMIVASRHIEFDLKNEIYQHYQSLDTQFYKKNRIGDLMNRISEDVGYVRMYLGPGIMYPINLVSLSAILIVEMWLIDKKLTLFTLAPLPVLSVLIYFISSHINRKSREVQEEQSNLSSYVQDIFSGIRVIKSYNQEKLIESNYTESAEKYREKSIGLANTQAFFFPLMILIIGLSQILILYAGGTSYIEGRIKEIGIIAQFFVYLNMLIWPFTSLGWVSMVIQRAEASMKRINEFWKQDAEVKNLNSTPHTISGNLVFDDVSFVHKNTGIQALSHISFSLKAGETLAILGKTGSGKTTLVEMISRLYDPNQGEIRIDNIPIKEMDLYCLRSQIGFVTQEAFLFSESIYNNLSFALDESSMEEVVEYAQKADIHHNIVNFKEQYDTEVGERGVTLSGGQKQRISIARALMKNPKILIFDDSLSAVDTETEKVILNNIKEASEKITTLIVTHRVSAAKFADKIIVLDKGKLIQKGTHEQLLGQAGAYKDLYETQL